MIKSMTGFGTGDFENDSFKVHVEIKTVNQRYLEINFHMHHTLNMFEGDISKKIKEYISRGKLDININFKDLREKAVSITVDKGLVDAYSKALDDINQQLGSDKKYSAMDIVRFPDVLSVDDETNDMEEAKPAILAAVEDALKGLVAMRECEGSNIKEDLLSRITTLEGYVKQLEKLAPEIVDNYRQRLTTLLEQYLAKEDIDENRIIQETAMFTDKVNYTEELVRLYSHFNQFREIINLDGPVGRKIDFLIQEMNREINTAASKANSSGVAQIAVDVKCEIEKIREQIQNIE
ncbi:MAG: YicC family protein [Anaerovibrio sp.]|uniref:YicC/YloC family endoribonuclease n=1 Tax=Anaerovibrio sp. TaxID=1872532 RepID=UPI0025E9EF3D|nr:YicC/YloC family endoribonuclease [Anaerovibrio sp.]MCR5176348.1 YicC family protein [Anaerovibrio sp.]